MRILIVGNGVAGQTAAERLRKMDDASNKKVEITLFAEEKYPYYTRIFLPQYLAGMKETEDLIMRDEKWYKEHDIGFLKGHKINKLKPDDHEVVTEQGDNYSYDKLILTTGSNARKIDFGHPDMDGLFTLRSIQDADEIRMYMSKNKVNEIFIVGGGLLGIELAYHLVEAGHQVTVCEIADYLLPRQLDKGSAEMLQDYLESKNINIVCGNKISCVRDYEDHKEIELDGGKIIKSDMILEQVGIIPEISLAESAGLK